MTFELKHTGTKKRLASKKKIEYGRSRVSIKSSKI